MSKYLIKMNVTVPVYSLNVITRKFKMTRVKNDICSSQDISVWGLKPLHSERKMHKLGAERRLSVASSAWGPHTPRCDWLSHPHPTGD